VTEAPPARLDLPVLRAVTERAKADENSSTLEGHFSVFDNWFEINSMFEGHFMERTASGSFKRTFNAFRDASRPTIHVLFEHGLDPTVGDKPLGRFSSLNEDRTGASYEAELFDTPYVNDLLPALRSGIYGSSYRFQVVRDEWDYDPEPSDFNPDGIPQRTILEQRVFEAGPTLFPANPAATANVRSATDWYYEGLRRKDPKVVETYLERAISQRTASAPARTSEDDSRTGTRRTPQAIRQIYRKYIV
jgi:hypothetical protein